MAHELVFFLKRLAYYRLSQGAKFYQGMDRLIHRTFGLCCTKRCSFVENLSTGRKLHGNGSSVQRNNEVS